MAGKFAPNDGVFGLQPLKVRDYSLTLEVFFFAWAGLKLLV